VLQLDGHDYCGTSELALEIGDRPEYQWRAWPDPVTGPFRLRLWIGRVDGRSAVVGVELWGVDPKLVDKPAWPTELDDLPDAAIRAADVRVPLGRFLDGWIDHRRAFARASREWFAEIPGHEETVRAFEERLQPRRPAGRPRLSDEHLGLVTAVYNAAVTEGDRAPAYRVMEELGARTVETARGWVRQARKRGFPVEPPPSATGASTRQTEDE